MPTTKDHPRKPRLRPAALAGWLAAVVLVFWFFDAIRFVALGFLATAAVAATLWPIVRRIPANRKIAASLVAVGVLLVTAGSLTGIGWLLASPVQREFERWPEIREDLNEQLAGLSERLGLSEPLSIERGKSLVANFFRNGDTGEMLDTTTDYLIATVISLAFLFFGSAFLLMSRKQNLAEPALALCPPGARDPFRRTMQDLEPGLRWWVIGTFISMATVGVTSWLGYGAVGLEFALPLAVLAGLLEIVPILGPFIAWIIALLFASVQGVGMMIQVTAVYAVVQALESWVVQPVVMRRTVKMPPIVTLFTVVFWGKALGFAGILLAVPINLVVWTLARNFVHARRDARD